MLFLDLTEAREAFPAALRDSTTQCHGKWHESPGVGLPNKMQDAQLIMNPELGALCFHLLNLATLFRVGPPPPIECKLTAGGLVLICI